VVLDGYVRVSQVRGREGESFISPSDQRENIERCIAMRRARVGQIFEEFDQSGARDDRPKLAKAIARVEAGQSDGLVVSELDRFGRSLVHGLAAIERIHAAGGTFVSVNNGFDLSTDNGRLVLHLMLSLAEWDLDRIRSRWRTARTHAVARGVHMGGRPPAGYVRDDSRRLHPDPVHGPAVREAFQRRAAGATLVEVADFLEQAGVPTAYGSTRWSLTALRVLLTNPVYIGDLRNGDLVKHGAHVPLVDPVTWHLAQSPRPRTTTPHGRPAVLGGLLRCAGCGSSMQAQPVVRNGRRVGTYACRRDDCPASAFINANVIEPHVEAAFFIVVEQTSASTELHRLEGSVKRAHKALVAYRDDPAILATLGSEGFAEGLAVRARRERETVARLADARDARAVLEPGGRDRWERRWPELSVTERRDAIARLIDRVEVSRGSAPVSERVVVLPRETGTGPVEMGSPKARWKGARVEAALRDFVRGKWPHDEQFIAAGRGPLLREVNATGGPPRWARIIGATEAPARARGYWTDDQIRCTLAVLLDGRRTWPSRREFAALGYEGLHGAMARRGRRLWEQEFGFTSRPGVSDTRRWTPAAVEAALDDLCRGRDTYPSYADFQAAGLDGLHQAIRARHGGHARWARELALPRQGGRRPPQAVRRWTDVLVEQHLRDLVASLGADRYPLQREFRAAGRGGLWRHIKATRGHTWWAGRLDVPRPTARPRRP
jgi:site-specific DNA recombinase